MTRLGPMHRVAVRPVLKPSFTTVMAAGLLVLVGCSSTVRSGPGPKVNSTAATQAAPAAQAATTEVPTTEAAAAAASTSKALYLSGPVSIPAGDPAKLSVVLTGSGGSSDSSLPVVVRNNTTKSLERVEVTGVARNASGALAGSGSSQGFTPSTVQPGEWTFGYVYFSSFTSGIPSGLKFDLTATGETASSTSLFKDVDLPIAEVKLAGSSIVGIVSNPGTKTIDPVDVGYICFNGSTPLKSGTDYTEGSNGIPAGGTGSFSIDLYDHPCPVYALGAHGR